MSCQQWVICFTKKLPPWLPVNSVKLVLKIHCTLFGFARKWKVHGVCSFASTKWTFLLQQIFVSKLIDFWRLKMITGRNAISSWLLWSRRNALHYGRLVQPIANNSALVGNLLQKFLATQDVELESLYHLMCNIGSLQIKILTSLTLKQFFSKLLIQLELGL